METYKELQEQIKSLQSRAEEVRRNEIERTVTEILQRMQDLGITLKDLERADGRQKGGRKTPQAVAPKYRDPVSGKTWSGRGKEPRWIGGRKKEDFLINK